MFSLLPVIVPALVGRTEREADRCHPVEGNTRASRHASIWCTHVVALEGTPDLGHSFGFLKPKTKEVNHESNPIIGCGLSHRVVVSRVCGTGVIQQYV